MAGSREGRGRPVAGQDGQGGRQRQGAAGGGGGGAVVRLEEVAGADGHNRCVRPSAPSETDSDTGPEQARCDRGHADSDTLTRIR